MHLVRMANHVGILMAIANVSSIKAFQWISGHVAGSRCYNLKHFVTPRSIRFTHNAFQRCSAYPPVTRQRDCIGKERPPAQLAGRFDTVLRIWSPRANPVACGFGGPVCPAIFFACRFCKRRAFCTRVLPKRPVLSRTAMHFVPACHALRACKGTKHARQNLSNFMFVSGGIQATLHRPTTFLSHALTSSRGDAHANAVHVICFAILRMDDQRGVARNQGFNQPSPARVAP